MTDFTKKNDTYTFPLPENPILVVIADSIGEVYTEVVKVTILKIEEPPAEGENPEGENPEGGEGQVPPPQDGEGEVPPPQDGER